MIRSVSLSLYLAAAFAALTARAATPRLCIDGVCRDYKCGTALDASNEKRAFVYGAAGARSLGILNAGERVVSCAAPATAIELRVSPAVATKLQIDDLATKLAWQVALSADEAAKPIKLSLARGTYEIAATADHFVAFRRTAASSLKPVAIPISLARLPRLAGTVLDGVTGRPIVRARVATDTSAGTVTDEQGRFSLEAEPQKWPKLVSVHADGFGEKTIRVPSARADVTFDNIYLSDASSITVEIGGKAVSQVVAVDLQKLRYNGRAAGPTVKTIDVTKDAKLVFDSVDAGEYAVIARGKDPWQRYSQSVRIGPHDQQVAALAIDPFEVHLALRNSPTDDARSLVILRSRDGFWDANVPLAHNAADLSLWQGGSFTATVGIPGVTPFKDSKTISDGISADWIIDVPANEVVGTVIDGETREPIPNAAVALRMKLADGTELNVRTSAGQDGAFRFSPVMPGTHRIKVGAKGYPVEEMSYVFAETEASHGLRVAMRRVPTTTLTVLDARAGPVANAFVIDARDGSTVGKTDALGATPIFFNSGSTRQLFIVPLDGSLGFAIVTSNQQDATVTLADGNARIVLRAETETHDPLLGVTIDMRYNGIRVPDRVLEALDGRGSRTASDAQGRIVLEHMPPGVYQFWPVASRADMNAIDRGGAPAVTLNAAPGENVAVLTFAPAPRT